MGHFCPAKKQQDDLQDITEAPEGMNNVGIWLGLASLQSPCTYELWSRFFKGGYVEDDIGEYYRAIKQYITSLD